MNTLHSLSLFLQSEANNYFVLVCFLVNCIISFLLYAQLDSKHIEISNRLLRVMENQSDVLDWTHKSLTHLSNIVFKQRDIIKKIINKVSSVNEEK